MHSSPDCVTQATARRLPFLFGVIALALTLIGVGWGLPSEFSPAIDSPIPFENLAFFADYRDASTAERYPAFHKFVLLPPFGAVFGVTWITGGLDLGELSSASPYGMSDPAATMSALILVSRVVGVIMSVGALLALLTLRHTAITPRARYAGALMLLFSGIFAYYARAENVDMPYVFWLAIAAACLWRYFFFARRGDDHADAPGTARPGRMLITAGIACACAVGTKDQAGGVVIGFGLLVLLVDPDHGAKGWRARLTAAARLTITAMIVYALVAIAPQPARWLAHLRYWSLDGRAITPFIDYEPTIAGQIGLLNDTIGDLTDTLSLPGLVLAFGGIALLARRAPKTAIFFALPTIAYYAIVIMPIRYTDERFMLPMAWLLAIPLGVALERLLQPIGSGVIRAAFGMAAFVILGFHVTTGWMPVTWAMVGDQKAALAAGLPAILPPDDAAPIEWQQSRETTTLPNADIYQRYRLRLRDGVTPESRAVAHVFTLDDERPVYQLSARPFLDAQGNLGVPPGWTLEAMFRHPGWVRRNVHVPVLQEFYLYRLPAE